MRTSLLAELPPGPRVQSEPRPDIRSMLLLALLPETTGPLSVPLPAGIALIAVLPAASLTRLPGQPPEQIGRVSAGHPVPRAHSGPEHYTRIVFESEPLPALKFLSEPESAVLSTGLPAALPGPITVTLFQPVDRQERLSAVSPALRAEKQPRPGYRSSPLAAHKPVWKARHLRRF